MADLSFSFRLSRKKGLCLSVWKLRISHGSFTTWWPAETATAAGTLAASAASAHSGTKFKKSAKIKNKIIDFTYACKSLTDFENEANEMTGNGNYLCEYAETCLEKVIKPLQVNLFLAVFSHLEPLWSSLSSIGLHRVIKVLCVFLALLTYLLIYVIGNAIIAPTAVHVIIQVVY